MPQSIFLKKNEQIQQMKIVNFEKVMRSRKTFYNFKNNPTKRYVTYHKESNVSFIGLAKVRAICDEFQM